MWAEVPWLGFDTETTGVNVNSDRIVTAAGVLRMGGTQATKDHIHNWLADPGIPIPAAATAVHGISTAYAQAHGADHAQVVDHVATTLAEHLRRGYPIVAFNAPYDIHILANNLAFHSLPSLEQRCGGAPLLVLDPLVLDRHLVPYRRGKRTLSDLCAAYGIEVSENAHTADADVLMTLDVLAAMVRDFPQISDMSLPELHAAQEEWHAEWAEDFERYLRSKGRDTHISRQWL